MDGGKTESDPPAHAPSGLSHSFWAFDARKKKRERKRPNPWLIAGRFSLFIPRGLSQRRAFCGPVGGERAHNAARASPWRGGRCTSRPGVAGRAAIVLAGWGGAGGECPRSRAPTLVASLFSFFRRCLLCFASWNGATAGRAGRVLGQSTADAARPITCTRAHSIKRIMGYTTADSHQISAGKRKGALGVHIERRAGRASPSLRVPRFCTGSPVCRNAAETRRKQEGRSGCHWALAWGACPEP